MNANVRWWEAEWFDEWERLALHQAAQVDRPAARKPRSSVSTAPADTGENAVRVELRAACADPH
jgi:hypothetical protein